MRRKCYEVYKLYMVYIRCEVYIVHERYEVYIVYEVSMGVHGVHGV